MAYKMKDASYAEYVKQAKDEGLTPVPREQYTWNFWLEWDKAHGEMNAVNNEHGVDWAWLLEHEPEVFNRQFGKFSYPVTHKGNCGTH